MLDAGRWEGEGGSAAGGADAIAERYDRCGVQRAAPVVNAINQPSCVGDLSDHVNARDGERQCQVQVCRYNIEGPLNLFSELDAAV